MNTPWPNVLALVGKNVEVNTNLSTYYRARLSAVDRRPGVKPSLTLTEVYVYEIDPADQGWIRKGQIRACVVIACSLVTDIKGL